MYFIYNLILDLYNLQIYSYDSSKLANLVSKFSLLNRKVLIILERTN